MEGMLTQQLKGLTRQCEKTLAQHFCLEMVNSAGGKNVGQQSANTSTHGVAKTLKHTDQSCSCPRFLSIPWDSGFAG